MKNKIAFVFPGQGSQYAGMGQELAEKYPVARRIFDEADKLKPLSTLCFEGPEDELKKTVNTQPALLTTGTACMEVLRSHGVYPDFVAGHSLGEYTALVTAGALTFPEALSLVMTRSRLMEEAVPQGIGGMAAILGLNGQEVEALCQEIAPSVLVEPANFNCPGQVVIAGYKEGVAKATELARKRGARRVIPLAVSGPFHSRLMEPASQMLAKELSKVAWGEIRIPIIANATAQFIQDPRGIATSLADQVMKPVRWEESVLLLYAQGVRTFVEVGPGKVLSGLIKKTVKDVLLLNVEDESSFHATIAKLQEVV